MTEFTTWRSLVDGAEISAIPDSGMLHAHYDATQLGQSDGSSVDTWTDESENGYDATGGSPIYREDGINGHPALEFDGTDDTFSVSSSDWDDLEDPFTIYGVVELVGVSSRGSIINHPTSTGTSDRIIFRWDPDWRVLAVNNGFTGSSDDSVQMLGLIFDGDDGILREDGSETASESNSGEMMDALQIGSQRDEEEYWDGYMGEILIYDGEPSISDVESYLSAKWDL